MKYCKYFCGIYKFLFKIIIFGFYILDKNLKFLIFEFGFLKILFIRLTILNKALNVFTLCNK